MLPKGTRIEADFWYDNTKERGTVRGFDPNLSIGYGERTVDEMALGFLSYVELDDHDATTDNNN